MSRLGGRKKQCQKAMGRRAGIGMYLCRVRVRASTSAFAKRGLSMCVGARLVASTGSVCVLWNTCKRVHLRLQPDIVYPWDTYKLHGWYFVSSSTRTYLLAREGQGEGYRQEYLKLNIHLLHIYGSTALHVFTYSHIHRSRRSSPRNYPRRLSSEIFPKRASRARGMLTASSQAHEMASRPRLDHIKQR